VGYNTDRKIVQNYRFDCKDMKNFLFWFPNALHSYQWGLEGNTN